MKNSELYSKILESSSVQKDTVAEFERSKNLMDVRKLFIDRRDYEDTGYGRSDVNEFYQFAKNELSDINYSETDLTAIAREAEDPKELVMSEGVFLSAAFNLLDEDQITFPDLERIDYVGLENSGQIVIEGSVGRRLGTDMIEGQIWVEGDAEGYVGRGMKTGEIVVEGNAKSVYGPEDDGEIEVKNNSITFGEKLEAGRLHLEGDGQYVGASMTGGEIFVGGNVVGNPQGFVGASRSDRTKGSRESVKNGVGYNMSGGQIHVEGDVMAAGELMSGGEIRIDGDAEEVGYDMTGGRVYIGGEIEEIPEEFEGGEIYQNQDGNWEQVAP